MQVDAVKAGNESLPAGHRCSLKAQPMAAPHLGTETPPAPPRPPTGADSAWPPTGPETGAPGPLPGAGPGQTRAQLPGGGFPAGCAARPGPARRSPACRTPPSSSRIHWTSRTETRSNTSTSRADQEGRGAARRGGRGGSPALQSRRQRPRRAGWRREPQAEAGPAARLQSSCSSPLPWFLQ